MIDLANQSPVEVALDQALQVPNEIVAAQQVGPQELVASDSLPERSPSRIRRLGKFVTNREVAMRAGAEVVGIGVDALLIGAGNAGVGALRGVMTREITATAPEITFLEKFLPVRHESIANQQPPSRLRKFGRKMLNL